MIEADVNPCQVKQIDFISDSGGRDCRAELHSVLLLAPADQEDQDAESDDSSTSRLKLRGTWTKAGRVTDATFRQFGYDRNCHSVSEYIQDKTAGGEQQLGIYRVCSFGRSYKLNEDLLRDFMQDEHMRAAMMRACGVRTLNRVVYQEVMKLRGPRELLVNCDHNAFLRRQSTIVKAVQESLKGLRRILEVHLFPNKDYARWYQFFFLDNALYACRSKENVKVMASFKNVCSRPENQITEDL